MTQRPIPPRPNVATLRDCGLFGGLDDAVLQTLADELPVSIVDPGRDVVSEGDSARELYIVLSGELEVLKKSKRGTEARVAVLGPGDWFGEMAILDVQPRSATVRAVAPTVMLHLSAEHVDKLLYRRDLKSYALLMMNIARELSRRLRVLDGIVAEMVASVFDEYMEGQGSRRPSRPPPPPRS